MAQFGRALAQAPQREHILSSITPDLIQAYREDGVVCLRQLLSAEWMMLLGLGVKRNMTNPGPEACTHYAETPERSFYDDKMNFDVVPEYQRFVIGSPLIDAVAKLMQSENVWLYYDQIFIKAGGEARRTPWHQDTPRLITSGDDMATIWISLDPLSKSEALEFVAGSHHKPPYGSPALDPNSDTTPLAEEGYLPLPDIESERDKWDIRSWATEPGDVLVFHPGVLHGGGAAREDGRRRSFSLRVFGDDVVYSPTEGFYEGHALVMYPGASEIFTPGEPLRHPWFPHLRGPAQMSSAA